MDNFDSPLELDMGALDGVDDIDDLLPLGDPQQQQQQQQQQGVAAAADAGPWWSRLYAWCLLWVLHWTSTVAFQLPEELFARGDQAGVHPSVLLVTVLDAFDGLLKVFAVPVKAFALNGFEQQAMGPGREGLLLDFLGFAVDPTDRSSVVPLMADGVDPAIRFHEVPGERHQRTNAFTECANRVGLDGESPLPRLVNDAAMRAAEVGVNLAVILRPEQQQEGLVDHTAAVENRRWYGVLRPRMRYHVQVVGGMGGGVLQVALLWAAPGSRVEQRRRHKRLKALVLVDTRTAD